MAMSTNIVKALRDQQQQQADMSLEAALKQQQNAFSGLRIGNFNRQAQQPAPVTLPENLKAFGFQESDMPFLKQSDLQLAYQAGGQDALIVPGVGVVGLPMFGGLINRQRGINSGQEEAKKALSARFLEMKNRREEEARRREEEARRQAGIDQVISSNPLAYGSFNRAEATSIYDLQKQGLTFDQARKKSMIDLYGIDEDLNKN